MENGLPDNDIFPVVHLPIEGHTVWPVIMRLVVIGSTVAVILLTLALFLMVPPEQLDIRPAQLMTGLTGVVIFEIVLFRRLLIPLSGDYGRYCINSDHVDFYRLSSLGMKTLEQADPIPMADFKGIIIQPVIFRDGNQRYYVTLSHRQISDSIRVKLFNSHGDASLYAEALSQALSLGFIRTVTI